MNIETRIEAKRGCGYRKPGGKYFVSDGVAVSCGLLPIEAEICPCCNQGIKQSRGWAWVSFELLNIKEDQCPTCVMANRTSCYPFNGMVEQFGLMWAGKQFYPTPEDFVKEAADVGISKRFSSLPKDFVLGETWLLIAHKEAIKVFELPLADLPINEPTYKPGIFYVCQPTRIEYVVDTSDSDKKLERLVKQGFMLINVIPDEEQIEMDLSSSEGVNKTLGALRKLFTWDF
jgi:hypothetical protein